MERLISFTAGNKTLNIITEVGTMYLKLGMNLLDDVNATIMCALEAEFYMNAEQITTKMFQMWLERNGSKATWSSLIFALRETKMHTLADAIGNEM